ncbi:NAD(P)/FAD-dependent oxidoreductase [Aurantibacter sp.]|uniref:NAD(P)/FAD-dependent oxidoreductase n=1 Tax=Aurantibacter sp. TaxID=2807103 RepID=UPI003265602E
MKKYDIIIVGGGLAGLTAAIDSKLKGHTVLVIEKKAYPHHKVCGEYVSNEVLPYLNSLGIFLDKYGAMNINTMQFSTVAGDAVSTHLPLGGVGISRYAFDNILYKKATNLGVKFCFQSALSIQFENAQFEVATDQKGIYTSSIVIGAYGKRSTLDKQLKRDFIQHKSAWLAVKAHYKYAFPSNLVALHNFKGGYGGLSKVESGAVNFCYLANYADFQKEKNIDNFNKNVVSKNPFLASFLKNAEPLFEEPLTIAQISFNSKKAVESEVLMCGDTAGLIHPLCGNGMSMAIHAAKIASELIHKFLADKNYSRIQLNEDYQKEWNFTFRQRLWVGRRVQSILMNQTLSNVALSTAVKSPQILRTLIERTHGKPIQI